MWTCEQCGCQAIAESVLVCPMCGKERDMPKATVSSGGSNAWAAGPVPAAVIEQYTAATAHPADEAQDIVASGGLTLKKPGVSGA